MHALHFNFLHIPEGVCISNSESCIVCIRAQLPLEMIKILSYALFYHEKVCEFNFP